MFLYVLPRHTNIMTNKGFDLFDECVHLSPWEVQWTDGDSKINTYTFGSIANSQKILTEINESGAVAKIRI